MRKITKKIYENSPVFLKKIIVLIYDYYGFVICKLKYKKKVNITYRKTAQKKNILFYHISGLSFGGTEKFLQIIAKHINKEKYNTYFLYAGDDGRKKYLENYGVNLIKFSYNLNSKKYPYYINRMDPDVMDVIRDKNINLIITATDGHSYFPINMIRNTPIILINIFGAPTLQKNIVKNFCISNEVASKISKIVSREKIETLYIQSENPDTESIKTGQELRKKLNIKESDFVFGRIGRADNGIFDPIGIGAFKKISKGFPNTHYLIMSPPPILIEKMETEKINNVHFLSPSYDEKDIWSFHQAIDCLAHFRKDGESCGLNIAESMLCGKPVISHKSTIWNAHLEYLDNSFSRIAEIDNIEQYANFMKEMIEAKNNGKIIGMGEKAKERAKKLFLIQNNISKIEKIIEDSIK